MNKIYKDANPFMEILLIIFMCLGIFFILIVCILNKVPVILNFLSSLFFICPIGYYILIKKYFFFTPITYDEKSICYRDIAYDWKQVKITLLYYCEPLAYRVGYCFVFSDHYILEEEIKKAIKLGFYFYIIPHNVKNLENILNFYEDKVKIPKTIHFLENNYMMIWIVVVVTPVITWLCVAAMGFSSWSKEWCLLSYFFSMVISFIGMLAELEIYVTNMKTEENTALNLLIQHDRAEYQKIKNQIDMVNIRYHDLRHRYEALENFRSEESQSPYDLTFDTGDIALNYVLMEKNPIFTKKKIRITCFASELDIKHIKEEDKYSLFENAIMNAVNAVEKLDAEKRTISITAFKKGMFYHICVENYYEGTITIENGLPRTDKDGNGHGYGMKSMRSIATSYGGRVEISFEDEIFSLNILLPVTSKDRL